MKIIEKALDSSVTGENETCEAQLYAYADDLAKAMASIEKLALHESVTGLPNMAWLERYAIDVLGPPSSPATVLVISMNNLGVVNDLMGVEGGDLLVAETANRLASVIEARETLVHVSGATFALLIPNNADDLVARRRADAVKTAIGRQALDLAGIRLDPQVRIGIALTMEHANKFWKIVREADSARLCSRPELDEITVFQHDRGPGQHSRRLLQSLTKAIADDTLALHYQPKVDLNSMAVTCVEALVRWTDPELGPVSPGVFVPLSERTLIINDMTHWVIQRAIEDCAQWCKAGHAVNVAINISARDLLITDLPEIIKKALARNQLDPGRLIIEITETQLIQHLQRTDNAIRRLADTGVSIAIDDFGVGYSSLAYLASLPARELKLDRSFITDLGTLPSNIQIVAATIDLAHRLGKQVTAEGVEDRQTLLMLEALGCDQAQGYYIAKPMPVTNLHDWLQQAPSLQAEHEMSLALADERSTG